MSDDARNSAALQLDDDDESVRIAVRALDDMRNRNQHTGSSDTSSNSPFVARMTHFPLVTSALKAYEHGKAFSPVVKYSAEIMESSVKSISRPVIDRLPVNVNQLDEFACRQLDRLDRYRHPENTNNTPGNNNNNSNSNNSPPPSDDSSTTMTATITNTTASAPTLVHDESTDPDHVPPRVKLKTKTLDGSADGDWDMERERGGDRDNKEEEKPENDWDALRLGRRRWKTHPGKDGVPSWLEANSPFVGRPPPPPDSIDMSSTPSHSRTHSRSDSASSIRPSQSQSHSPSIAGTNPPPSDHQVQVAQRSRWQAVLFEAGGLSAALSEESMRKLGYCLQWLQYATAHIDAQILILRDFIASIQPLPPHPTSPTASSSSHHRHSSTSSTGSSTHAISQTHVRTLAAVRRDLVQTVRQVVDVLSRYAGGALPEPARGRVRGFILELPGRWARRAGVGGGAEEREGDGPRERESVAAAGGGATRRGGRRPAGRERGAGGAGSVASSRAASPLAERDRDGAGGAGEREMTAGTAVVAAQRILTLALESLDMVRGVTGVLKESLDRADVWVERLRTVGIQRGGRGGDDTESIAAGASGHADPMVPPPLHQAGAHMRRRHRRGSSSVSVSQLESGDDREDGNDRDGMETETEGEFASGTYSYYSGASSSYAGGSSVPSTPGGGGAHTPAYVYAYEGRRMAEADARGGEGEGGGREYAQREQGEGPYATPRVLRPEGGGGGAADVRSRGEGEDRAREDRDRDGEGVRIVGMDVEDVDVDVDVEDTVAGAKGDEGGKGAQRRGGGVPMEVDVDVDV